MTDTLLRIADEGDKALPRKINFTVTALASIVCPAGKPRIYVYDAKAPGLAYLVTSNGAKSFYFVRRFQNQFRRVRIGGPEIPIDEARRIAAEKNGEIARGIDPAAGKRALRASVTLQELFDRYVKDHSELRCTERTRITDKSRFDTCFENWKSRKIATIHEEDVRNLHIAIGKSRGQVTANRAMQLLRRIINFANITPNPVRMSPNPKSKALNPFGEESRERIVRPDELPKLFAALDAPETTPLAKDFIYTCLWTGARRSNVASMRDEEINLATSTWIIPGSKSKNGKPMSIHLSPPALAIVKPRMGNEGGYIFPGDGKTGHFVEPKWSWGDVLKRAGLVDLHIHDLRRTFGSFQANLGTSLAVVGKSLGHGAGSHATAIYARLNLDPVRVSVDAAAAAMQATANPPKAVKKATDKKKRTK